MPSVLGKPAEKRRCGYGIFSPKILTTMPQGNAVSSPTATTQRYLLTIPVPAFVNSRGPFWKQSRILAVFELYAYPVDVENPLDEAGTRANYCLILGKRSTYYLCSPQPRGYCGKAGEFSYSSIYSGPANLLIQRLWSTRRLAAAKINMSFELHTPAFFLVCQTGD